MARRWVVLPGNARSLTTSTWISTSFTVDIEGGYSTAASRFFARADLSDATRLQRHVIGLDTRKRDSKKTRWQQFMKVSVVLTTYNRAHVLSQTIDSILRQTLHDFELIITDNCSTDGTEEIGRKYEYLDSRVRYRRNDQNLYMPGNLNAGIREAR